MIDDNTPLSRAAVLGSPLSKLSRGMKNVIRRARIEHLSGELLRLAQLQRLPVPVEELLTSPPLDLWTLPYDPPSDYPTALPQSPEGRMDIARAIARLVAESRWEMCHKLLGDKPLSEYEVDVFAAALLLPTALLAGINERQRTPNNVALLFQVPLAYAVTRLAELGYLRDMERYESEML